MLSKENEERTAKEKYEKKVQDDAERRRKNQENMSDVSTYILPSNYYVNFLEGIDSN